MAELDKEVQEFTEEPDVDALKADLERCRANLSYYLDQSEEASEASAEQSDAEYHQILDSL